MEQDNPPDEIESAPAIAGCPCGQPVTSLNITEGSSAKYAFVSGDCCGYWMIEFRTNHLPISDTRIAKFARRAWNDAPRAPRITDRGDGAYGGSKEKPTLVQIKWRDPENNWPWFLLLEMRGDWLHLQGADYPDGSAKHDGDCFWTHESAVLTMRSAWPSQARKGMDQR